ncbi:superoxide dismutase family protein [Psychrobacter sp.]|uniref:superoxide dismutase family protein n=1 Tax=Psychrobacter sp. TaxID=56811 RepID=UPI0025E8D152|nr:superoxide dismutase family protein [Psychrobacter sp.]
MKKLLATSAVLASALALSACQSTPTKGDLPAEVQPALEAQMQLVDISKAHLGKVYLRPVNGGVQVFGQLTGLHPGSTYAIHIHENGSCGNSGKDAGGHFNPLNKQHGNPNSLESHGGDLPNITADANGVANMNFLRRDISVDPQMANSVYNRSFIIHAGVDDYTSQPSGNSGDRMACGVIKAY